MPASTRDRTSLLTLVRSWLKSGEVSRSRTPRSPNRASTSAESGMSEVPSATNKPLKTI
ncbi:hypothetical protein [Saccharomonospora iraqiensis]|uniref:hypothetical protein n=1 Tax=Saccharomonospora iraqiensis TaxID=52698 RepID=UPI0018DEAFAA|nr:hypothetical protein [Saccharomonospora iraqiensis]